MGTKRGITMRKLLVLAVVGAVALAACGGGKSSPSVGAGATSPGGGSKGGNDFASLVAKTNAATYKVTYKSGSDTPFTISQQGKRFSYVSGDSATYVTADGAAISCSGTGASATCTSLPGSGDAIKQGLNSAFGALGALFATNAGKGIPGLSSITKTSSQTIAGRKATCATIDASSLGILGAALGKGSYSVCVDAQTGVMLSSKSDDGSGHVSQVSATAFGDPTDADLTPPATPQTIPGVTPST
jgi:hypothetical protein